MLKVKTYLDKSSIQGMGCFAAEPIVKGQLIWEFNPLIDKVFNESTVKLFSDIEREFVFTYSYKYDDMYYLCNDNARFFNHSIICNTYEDVVEYKTYASKDISIGEEILSDYNFFGKNETDKKFNM